MLAMLINIFTEPSMYEASAMDNGYGIVKITDTGRKTVLGYIFTTYEEAQLVALRMSLQ